MFKQTRLIALTLSSPGPRTHLRACVPSDPMRQREVLAALGACIDILGIFVLGENKIHARKALGEKYEGSSDRGRGSRIYDCDPSRCGGGGGAEEGSGKGKQTRDEVITQGPRW